MIYLVLSIICSSLIFLIFRAFKSYQVATFSAIVINYLVAGLCGFAFMYDQIKPAEILSSNWILYSAFLGIVFISLFNLMAVTSQKMGASVASIANKMALVVPVVFAIYYYDERINVLKILAVLLALAGVFLSTQKNKIKDKKFSWSYFLLTFLLFIGSGFIDTLLNYMEFEILQTNLDSALFASFTFITAFIIGAIVLLFKRAERSFTPNTIAGGIILGIVNYGSIYFILNALSHSGLEGSVLFPINNMAVVLFTTIASALLFKEKFSTRNKIGVLLALLSILIISFA